MRVFLAFGMLGLLGGCSLLNAPDRDLTPPDGGVDGGGIELFCDDGIDDDNDLAIDCADADCGEEPACCERRRTTLSYDWTSANLSASWSFAPDVWSPLRPSLGGATFVGGFLPANTPRSLVSHDCVSLGLGGWVVTTLYSTESGGCSASEPCEDYAAIVLTTATGSTEGSRLQDELAVTLHAGGLVLVTQAGAELARTQSNIQQDVALEVEVRPTLDESNQPVIVASVSVEGESILDDFTVTRTENLIAEGDCSEIPGVYVAAEGQGDLVYVGRIETAKQGCANPSQFDAQSATLRAENLEFNPSWTEAYVGAPALASSRNALSDTQWDLMVEGSNWSPELEPTTHVGYALGHARVATDEGSNWRLTGWESSEAPKVGDDPPACSGGTCADNRSAREPHLLAELNDEGELRDLTLAFARELVTAPTERDLFGIQIVRPVGSPATALTLPSTPTLSPEDIPECISLRDPALIPVDRDAIGGYWLLFTCIESAMPPRQIHAVRVSRSLEIVQEGSGPMRRTVLDADELGPFAAAGIRAPEPVISFMESGMRLRVWFLAQSTPGDWAVGLAEARTHDTELLEFDLPEPLPFPVNPILSNDSTLVLSGCLADQCNITGIAVTPRADDLSRLRFLLARRLKESDGDETFQLIPLEQTWSRP